MKKAFDQTVRDIKREVNKKVLKVPGIEQKVLDATSNEPWGPHGSLLADIAQASRNYHEYQIIMAVIWKRINDTGKNWRHVYKALTVLEYLVAHGSERVIDEIREHAYQISTLSDFQYIDSSGKDQGNNVRKKSQSLVVLVNDKERIQEARQKAAANRDKFRNTAMSNMYRPSSYSGTGGYGDRYDDDRYEGRYGSKDDDRSGYGGYRDDDRYGRYGDSYRRDGDRYSRDSEERYGRDSGRDDDYSGRRSLDGNQYSSRSRSCEREKDHAYEDDGQYSSRGSGAKADDHSQDGRRLDRKYSEQNLSVPPSYEEAVGEVQSPVHSERDGEVSAASTHRTSSPPVSEHVAKAPASSAPVPASPTVPDPSGDKEVDGFDQFDPRGSFSAASIASNGVEMDVLGSLSEAFSSNALAIMPVAPATTASEADAFSNSTSVPTFVASQSASTVTNQTFEDPFGDGPFKALPSTAVPSQSQNAASTSSFPPGTYHNSETPQNSFSNLSFVPSSAPNVQHPATDAQFSHQEPVTSNQDTDILADILPPSGPSFPTTSQMGFPTQAGQPTYIPAYPAQGGQPTSMTGYPAQSGQPTSISGFPGHGSQPALQSGFPAQTHQPASLMSFASQGGQPMSQPGFHTQASQLASQTGFPAQTVQPALHACFPALDGQPVHSANFYGTHQPGSTALQAPYVASQTPAGQSTQFSNPSFPPQASLAAPIASQMAPQIPSQAPSNTPIVSQPALSSSTGALVASQPVKDKFETKSAVWTDTLSRGLVNLNISGPKTNPLADIGIDFEAINRKEKRMEKPTTTPVTSTVTMGKAMGSGSGMGRTAASGFRPPPNPMVGSGMGMGMGMGGGPGHGMGMGGYGGMNQQPMGMGMGLNTPVNMAMGMGMNMGMGQGAQMQPTGFPPRSAMPGGYNPMMGSGGYMPQQPYGGSY